MGGPLSFSICLQMAVRCRYLPRELVAQVCAVAFFFAIRKRDPGKEFAIVEGPTCTLFLLANLQRYR
jgi:hypothetical protein